MIPLLDLADRLRVRGWLVPAYSLPANQQDLSIQRVLLRHGFSRDLADRLVEDLTRAVQTLGEHPPTTSRNESEAGSSSHTGKPSGS